MNRHTKLLPQVQATSEKVKEKEHKIATPNSGSKHALYTQRTLVVPLHPSTSTIVAIIGEGVWVITRFIGFLMSLCAIDVG